MFVNMTAADQDGHAQSTNPSSLATLGVRLGNDSDIKLTLTDIQNCCKRISRSYTGDNQSLQPT